MTIEVGANLIKKVAEIQEKVHHANLAYAKVWTEQILFTWQWWSLVVLAIGPWLLWWTLHNKESTYRLLFSGFFVLIVASWFDFLGISFGAWVYIVDLVPTIPTYVPYDFCILPVEVMFLIQYRWFPPFVNGAVFGVLNAFVAEPMFVLLNYFRMKHWEYFYSFGVYLVIYLIADWLSKRTRFASVNIDR